MLNVFLSAKFKRDYKRIEKQGRDMNLLLDVVDILAAEEPLDEKYRDHSLTGRYTGHRSAISSPIGC